MLTQRTLSEIQSLYFASLAAAGSNLVIDQKEGSLGYTLSRASAAIAASQDNRLIDIQNSASILRATGDRLDQIASFILEREPAAKATGSVMAVSKGDSTQIPVGSLLINATTGLQFVTIGQSVTAVSLFESAIPIKAVEAGYASNLVAGTQLFSSDYANVCFRVGQSRTDKYYGDLVGGRDLEDDDTYRSRVISHMTSSTLSSTAGLTRKLLQYPLVERAFVKTRAAGVIEIWVDAANTYTPEQKQELLDYVRPYIAAGATPVLIQAKRKLVNITLDIRPYANNAAEVSLLSSRINTLITNLLLGLDVGQGLSLSVLRQSVQALVRNVSVTYPISDVTAGVNEILAPGEIKYTFSSTVFN